MSQHPAPSADRPADPPPQAGPGIAAVIVIAWYALLILAALLTLLLAGTDVPRTIAGVTLGLALAAGPLAVLLAFTHRARTPDTSEVVQVMRTMQRESGLSETAKRVLHRREERNLLRNAIQQDIAAEDWDAALVLVDELAGRFGYRVDAEEFRTRIEEHRSASRDRAVMAALAGLDALIADRRWADAFTEVGRIQRLYPESHRVAGLPQRVEQARTQYQRDLERRFLLAADSESVDEAMGLLKELDQYFTPAEAEPLKEVARGVITKSRENLGVRFKLLVQDHEYAAALEMGQRITTEFPNTRMAQEVRDLLPMLQQRAATVAVKPISN